MVGMVIYILLSASLFAVNYPIQKENEIIHEIKKEFDRKEYQNAFDLWEKNHKKYPHSLQYDYWIGKILLYKPNQDHSQKKKNFDRAIQHFKKVIQHLEKKTFSSSETKKILLDSLLHISIAYFQISNLNSAILYMKKMIFVDNSIPEAWYNLAIFYESQNKIMDAKRIYNVYRKTLEMGKEEF